MRILELVEEDWEAATRLDEFEGLRARWYDQAASYPVFVVLDEQGGKVEEMKDAIERLEDGRCGADRHELVSRSQADGLTRLVTSGTGSDDLAESTLEADNREDDSLIRAIAAAPAVPISTLTPGTLVADKYRIVERLGRGGMGVVYAARRRRLERIVAMKFQRRTCRSGADDERLLREAQAMARLSHPNVGTVYEVGPHTSRCSSRWSSSTAARARLARGRARTWRGIVALTAPAGAGSRPRIASASCTATSSPTTCWSATMAACAWWTSGSRGRGTR